MSTSPLDNDIRLRKLELEDYNRGYLQLLEQLTTVGDITQTKWKTTFDDLPSNTHIYVIEDLDSQQVIAAASLFIEQKFIRNCHCCGHIEDVVVAQQYRRRNLGRTLVTKLLKIAREEGCYKTILDCDDHNVEFYKKCGLDVKGVQMGTYHK
ncbi:hypothetical protein P9112_013169 [Eukaryota sp. TZLM1-RC]